MTLVRSTKIALALTVLLAPLAPSAAHAQVVTYDSRSLFLSAVSAPTTATFSGQGAGALAVQYWNGGSVATNGVTLSSPANNALVVGNPTGIPGLDRGTGALEVLVPTNGNAAQLTIAFNAFERAFGLDFGSYTGQTDVFSYVLSNGQTGTFRNANTLALSFFGLSSDTPFNWVTLKVADAATAYDNVTYASALASPVTATPEPATWALMATGLLGVGAIARRRRTIPA